MIRSIQGIAFFIFAVLFFSTADAEIYTSIGSLKDGEYYPVFGDVVNLRSGPSVKNDSVGKLTAGAKVQIVSKSEVKYAQNNYSDYWYQIKASISGKDVSGYVWGGAISKAYVVKDFDGDKKLDMLLFGITNCDEEMFKWAEARIVKNGKIVSSLKFRIEDFSDSEESDKSEFVYSIGTEIYSQKINSFSFIKLESFYEACDYPGFFYLFATDGKSLYKVTNDTFSSGEGGGVKLTVSFEKAKLVLKRTVYENEFPESGDAVVKTIEENTAKYRYDGKTFVKE